MDDYSLLMRAADWNTTQKSVYTEIAERILRGNSRGRRMIALDGRPGVGKSLLAIELRVALARAGATSFVASMSDFKNERAVRERQGRDSATGYYDDTYNLSELKRNLIEPFLLGGSTAFVLDAYDAHAEQFVEPDWTTTGPDAILLVEGEFLARPALSRLWHGFIRVEAADAVRGSRMAKRDGAHPIVTHPSHAQREQANAHYESICDPVSRADIVFDNSDWESPVIR
ncbi:hypothetical protein [Agrococcus casei]|uniref:Uridine kinase n=1 Tax=Agrococcus casei LMG 22410 TaxID=1255656 RepID=A0A1R4FWM3_9MICO|nr:hypothetical protein [Agrococcus casei]SJM60122.1 Uridine kinase [Agrococcus casei LMG 22410]